MSVNLILGQLSDLDIRLLRVFRVIVECGGLSAVELELNISRSAISRHLKDLEIRMGGSIYATAGAPDSRLPTKVSRSTMQS